ncbi:HAD-IC family P-type ATPase [Leifsonia sp. H3M29-4]|uniref:HAD-IC family P-type ATPase n=1 Tax=Salinibacterium metalliresistens TaxID=3031321 RepID=UPI0023DAFEF6|nr:HAD-IC family P-type ATPase [Salinibacterium metalliresistens]MDF1477600.1 HAD-IC family P-type ATPase [Salinibacterium metalliresistens]
MTDLGATAGIGLTSAEVRERRERGEVNTLPDDTGRSFLRILYANVFTLFNAIAGAGFLLVLLLGYWQDALFGGFLIANVLIGVVQEFRAKLTLSRLSVLHAQKARVLRDGVVQEIAIAEVVLDDVILLSTGDQVVADAIVIEDGRLELDESLLTGEAEPVAGTVGREVLSGSSIVAGNGVARVVRVGGDSYANRVTREAKQFSLVNSELRTSIARVIRWISWLLLPIGAIVVNGQMQARGGWQAAIESGAWREAAVASVASLIGMVPQGLVFMTSVALAVGAVQLGRRGVLVQELAAVEGLARVDILCLDKTGTLTEGGVEFEAVEVLTEPRGWRHALAWFGADVHANATARALAGAFTDAAPEPVSTVEFSSARKWSAVSFDDGRARGTWLLGGPDILVADEDAVLDRARQLTSAGARTLMLAHVPEPMTTQQADSELLPDAITPVAFLTFREKLRPDARRILEYFDAEGVDLCIISGDDPRTVASVARAAGMTVTGHGFDARDLPEDAAALAEVMSRERVFGRVTPAQKKDMVIALQSAGHTVAMTGDGVNDALALKHADLGIAMGSGAPATRAVARIVLLDGQFSHLPRVVAEGRKVIANVERLAKLFLSKTVYAIALAVFFGAVLWPYPFLPRQLSIVDGLTIGLPALVLALLPNHPRYLAGFLGRAARFCIPSGLTIAGVLIPVVAYAYLSGQFDTAAIQGTAVITLTLTGLWVLVILSRPFNWWKACLVAAMYVGLVLVLATPIAREFLQLEVPPLELILISVAAAAVGTVVLEVLYRFGGARGSQAPASRSTRSAR